tara:strand:- start:970 stop:1149 length:180 start_codon:yes stop_codon:yes gene_type:complete
MENKKTGHPINIRFDDDTWSDFLRIHHGETLGSPNLKVNKKDLITDIFKLGMRKWHQQK